MFEGNERTCETDSHATQHSARIIAALAYMQARVCLADSTARENTQEATVGVDTRAARSRNSNTVT